MSVKRKTYMRALPTGMSIRQLAAGVKEATPGKEQLGSESANWWEVARGICWSSLRASEPMQKALRHLMGLLRNYLSNEDQAYLR
jgi:hypothetical protein